MAQQGSPPPVVTITAPLLPGGLDVVEDDRPRDPRQTRAPRPAGRRRLWTDVLVVGGVPVLVLLALAAFQQLSVLLGGEGSTTFLAPAGNGLAGGARTVLHEVVSATGTALRTRVHDTADSDSRQDQLAVPLLLTMVGPLLHAQLLRRRARGRARGQQVVLAITSSLLVTAVVVVSALLVAQTVHADGVTFHVDASAVRAGCSTAAVLAVTSVVALLLDRLRSPVLRAALRGAAATTGTALLLGYVALEATLLAATGGLGRGEFARALPSSVPVAPSYGVYAWTVSAFGRLTIRAQGPFTDGSDGAFGLHDRQGLSAALYVGALLLPLVASLVGLLAVVRTPGSDRRSRALALPLAALLSAAAFLPLAELSVLRITGTLGLREGPEPVRAAVPVLAVLLPLGLMLGLGVLLAPDRLRLAVPQLPAQPWRTLAARLPAGTAWPAALAVVAVLVLAGTGVASGVHHVTDSSETSISTSVGDDSSDDDGSSDDGSSDDSDTTIGGPGTPAVPMSDDATVTSLPLDVGRAEESRHDGEGSYTGDVDDLDVSVPTDVFVTIDDRGSSFCASANALSSGTTFSYDSTVGSVADTDTC